ncbi:replication protein RepA [Phreatobacter sp. HK31-P]
MHDESLIRDLDLRERLEAARGKALFSVERGMLISQQQRRDKEAAAAAEKAAALAALPRETRRRAIIREVFENEPPTIKDLRHIHSVLAICGLPYDRQPLDVRRYVKEQGQMSLAVYAQDLPNAEGQLVPQPLPYGPKARLILMHLCSEAVRQKSATIELADTFTAFVRDMGYDDAGGPRGSLTAFRQQLNALAACTMRITAWSGSTVKTKSFTPIEDFELWLSADPRQRSLWPSTLTFSPTMYDSLQRHALPVNVKAVRAFAGSARKLDLYFWLGYRLHNIERPLHISWNALGEQFGEGFTRQRDFQRKFAMEVEHVREVFPKLPLRLTEEGITLHPADPKVLALPTPRPIKKA